MRTASQPTALDLKFVIYRLKPLSSTNAPRGFTAFALGPRTPLDFIPRYIIIFEYTK